MDAIAFDGLTRKLGTTATRRGLLRVFGGVSLLSSGLLFSSYERSAAKHKRKSKRPRSKSRPVPPPSPADPPTAPPDSCSNRTDNAMCDGPGRCHDGTC